MIELVDGDIFHSLAEALICPVNCAGVMGKGLAKEFRKRFPAACANYELACRLGIVRLGRIYAARGSSIIFFPTKMHRRDPSFLSDVYRGLDDLAHEIPKMKLKSIAVPALGCGLGGLKWPDVEDCIRKHLGRLDCRVEIYPPR
jgi:O-acetyl-ADP-ribose deacetylase (regulator of RNase III)